MSLSEKSKYTLAELLKNEPHERTQEEQEWLDSPPVGREFGATVVERARQDQDFKRELIIEAIDLVASGETDAAIVLLEDLLAAYDSSQKLR